MRRQAAGWLAILFVSLSGCGTSLNLDGDSRIYGGVQEDVHKWRENLRLASADRPAQPGQMPPQWHMLQAAGALADMPLSLLADTLTLPVTIETAVEERIDKEPAATQTVVVMEKNMPSQTAPGRAPPRP
jgi:uncharacterized protein YceK